MGSVSGKTDRGKETVIKGDNVTFIIVPSVTTQWDKHVSLTSKKATKIYYDALLVKTNLQLQRLTWVHDGSKRQHNIIVQKVRDGKIKNLSDLMHEISQCVTYYGFAPVRLIPTKEEWFL